MQTDKERLEEIETVANAIEHVSGSCSEARLNCRYEYSIEILSDAAKAAGIECSFPLADASEAVALLEKNRRNRHNN